LYKRLTTRIRRYPSRRFFKMAAAAIFDYQNLDFVKVRRVHVCHSAKFGRNWSDRSKDTVIFSDVRYMLSPVRLSSVCLFSWSPYVIGQTNYILVLLSSIYLFFLALSQRPQVGCLPYFDTWCGPGANLECRSEMCCTRLAANAGPKQSPKIAIWAPSHNFVGLYLRN